MKFAFAIMLRKKARKSFARNAKRLAKAMAAANLAMRGFTQNKMGATSVGLSGKVSFTNVSFRPRICVVASALAFVCVPGAATSALAEHEMNVNSVAQPYGNQGSVNITKLRGHERADFIRLMHAANGGGNVFAGAGAGAGAGHAGEGGGVNASAFAAARLANQMATDAAQTASKQMNNMQVRHMLMQQARDSAMDLKGNIKGLGGVAHQASEMSSAVMQNASQNALTTIGNQAIQNLSIQNSSANAALDLNLKSGKNDILADIKVPVNITVGGSIGGGGAIVGGKTFTINPGDRISVAEHTAMMQAVNGNQTLLIANNGSASGGSLTLSDNAGQNFGNIFVPKNVSLNLVGFSSTSPLEAAGKTNILGTVNALQSASNVGSVFNLGSLNVHGSGVWTGSLPSTGSLSGLYDSASLTFNVTQGVSNSGQILSPGALNINAGGPISNLGSTTVLSGSSVALNSAQAITNSGLIAASQGNINLNSAIGQITNSGAVQAALGNINIGTQVPTNLTVNNIGGLISAANGNINIGNPSFTEKIDTTITGGDWKSNQINIDSGDGHIIGQVNNVTGQVNMKGGTAHFYADSDNLNIGNVSVTGDPIFTNTGDLTITGNQITNGNPLTYIAGGDIITTSSGVILNTSGATGGALTMIAGANYNIVGNVVTVTGPKSPDGGKIDLSTSPIALMDTHGTAGAGGNVTLIAYDGEGLNSGRILIPTTLTITTHGSAGNAGGNVMILGADRNAAAQQSIIMGGVNTYGGTSNAGTGNITIGATDIVMNGSFQVNNTTGAIISGSFSPGANQPRGVLINGNLTSNGANVDIRAGATANSPANALRVNGNIDNSVKSGTANGGAVSINIASANTFIVGGTGQANGVNGFIRSNAGPTGGNGGTISITNNASGGIQVATNSNNLQANATNGNGGSILLNGNTGAITLVGGSYSVSGVGANGSGGTIDIRGGSLAVTGTGPAFFTADATGSGNGGTINVLTSGNSSNITVGDANGNIRVSAAGGSTGSAAGDGGTINLGAGNNLTVDTAFSVAGPLGTNGNGALITYKAGLGASPAQGRLVVTSAINANGVGTGNGGSVTLESNSNQTFLVGGSTTNSINGAITANGATGGQISISNRSSGGVTIANAANLAADATNGDGGIIDLNAAGAGNLVFQAGGTLNANGAGATGNGGTINLSGNALTTAGFLTLNANGSGTGNGGNVNLLARGTNSDITLGAAAGNFTINANSGALDGNGGIVTVTAGRNIVASAGGFNAVASAAGNGDGAQFILTAGTGGQGNLFVPASLNADGAGTGDGGLIRLTSASAITFTIDATAVTNGVAGTLSANGANGGTIEIINNGTGAANGGITLPVLTNVSATAFNGNGGTVILNANPAAGADGVINIASGTFVSNGAGVNGDGGTINISGSDLNITGGTGLLSLNANGIGTGNGGTVRVESTSNTSNLSIGGAAGQRLEISANGVSGGTAAVLAGNNLTVNDVASFSASNTGGAGGHFILEAGNGLVPADGNLYVNGSLNANGSSGGSVRLVSQSGSVFDVNNGVVTNGINGTITAASNTSGSGGTIEIINQSSGGINLRNTNNVNVAAAGNGSGGRIYLDATGGVLTIPTASGASTLRASGVGTGALNGGTIDLRGADVNVTGIKLDLVANGSDTGNGGTARIIETGTSGITIGDNPGNFCIHVQSGLNGGNGGTVDLESQGTITVDPGCLVTNPRGTNGNGANITLFAGNQGCGGNSGNLVFTGNLIADGVGTGDGGIINIGVHSTQVFDIAVNGPNGVTGFISAKGGPIAGNGGQVFLKNWDNGGIRMSRPTDILVTATDGNGGTIDINAAACSTNQGAVTIPTTGGVFTFDASAGGGTHNGGIINITGTQVNVGGAGGSLIMKADGSGAGNGGSIHITTTDAVNGDVVIGNNSNNVQLSANSGAVDGNGGSIVIDAAHNLIANSGNFSVTPAGNGNGGVIRLHAGNGGAGLLQVVGNVSANGSGNGAGGIVEITLPMASSVGGPLMVGQIGAGNQSYVTGVITATAPGTGSGGDVTIKNTSATDLNISLTSTISAGSTAGTLGNVNFIVQNSAAGTGQDINVTPSSAGVGTITGFVNAVANHVTISADAVNEVLNVGTITGTDGTVILTATNTGGEIRVGEGRHVSATQDILITTNKLTVNGDVDTSEATGNIQITSLANLTVTGEGNISTFGSGANLINVQAANGFDLTLNSNINYIPTTSTSTVRFAAEGPGGDIFVAQGTSQTIRSGATLQIDTPTLHLGAGSGFTAIGASQVNITSGAVGSNPLTIETNGTATISTTAGPGIDIYGATGQDINFTHLGATSTLNLTGAPLEVHANGAGVKVNITTGQTVAGNNNICIELDGGTSVAPAVFLNNGTLTSSSSTGTINIGPGEPTAGSGTNYLNVDGTGTVSLTGNPTNGLIQIHAFDNRLTFLGTANQTLNAGSGANSGVTLGGYQSSGPGVEMKSGSRVNASASHVDIKTFNLVMENDSQINNARANGTINVALGSIVACDGTTINPTGAITVTSQGTGATAGRLQTNNGNIIITPTAGSNLTFDTIGGVAGTLNLLTGTGSVITTVSNATTTVATNTNLHVNGAQLTMNVNNGTLQNNGSINVDNNNNAGRINILSTGTLNVPIIANISVDPLSAGTSANGGRIDIIAAGALSINNGTIKANAVPTGTDANGNGGTINVSGSTVTIAPGADLLLQANGVGGVANGGTITFSALGATGDVTTGGGSGLVSMEAKGGITGNGGSVTVTAGRNVLIDGTAIDVSAGAIGNGGTVRITASNAGTNGSLTLSTGVTATGGTILGNGGNIFLTNNSTQNIVVDKPLNVSAGLSGAGGRIEIRNEGGGNIDVQTALNANSNGTGQNAGTIWLDANGSGVDGTVILNTIPFSATATGSGNGGTVIVEGGQIQIVGAVPQQIFANGGTTGNGGSISLTATNANGDISLAAGSGGLTLEARGGVTSGNGGTISLSAGRNVSIQGSNTVLDVSPRGGDSNGGTINLLAGQTNTTGLVQVNGELNADGINGGNGGTININYRDPDGGTFMVGNTSVGSYVNGNIHADAPGTGVGGNITFTNADGAGVNVGNIVIELQGPTSAISAGSGVAGTANLGNINFNAANSNVDVHGLNDGDGRLTGFVNSTARDIFINPKEANTTLVAGTVLATNGNAHLEVSCDDNSQLIVPLGKSVISTLGEAQLEGHTITIAGLVQGQTNVRLEQDTLINTGTVNAVTGTLFIDACQDNGDLTVTINGLGVFRADNGNIQFNTINSGGKIDVTGTGTVGTNPNGLIVFGDRTLAEVNTVNADVGSFVGSIVGAGTTVDIAANNSNLTIGTLGGEKLISTTGDINLTARGLVAGGTVTFNGDATAAQNIKVITHSGIINLGTNADVTATAGDINIQSTAAANALTVNFAANSTLNASSVAGDIVFNNTASGNVLLTGAGNGLINSGNTVSFNPTGGAVGIVNGYVDEIRGNIIGSGTSVTLRTDNGNLNIGTATGGTLAATTGNLALTATGQTTGGNINFNGDASAAGSALLIADADGTGTVQFANGADLTAGTGVDINTRNLILGGVNVADNSSIVTAAGNLTVHNSVGTRALDITLPALSLLQSTTGDAIFNLVGEEGAVTVNGGAGVGTTGAINAGDSAVNLNHVRFNGGTNQISVGVEHIHGCIGGSGDSFLLTVVNVSPFSNDVHLGGITTHNDFNFTSPGALTICGPITASNTNPGQDPSITLNTANGSTLTQETGVDVTADGSVNYSTNGGTITLQNGADVNAGTGINMNASNLTLGGLNVADNSSLVTATGDILIQNNQGAHTLAVTLPDQSLIQASTGDVTFNSIGAEGAITINGGAGVGTTGGINAGNSATEINHVTFNGGTNQVSVGVEHIHGCIGGTGDPFLLTVVNVSPFTNDVHLGNISTHMDFSFTSPGNLTVCGPITASNVGTDPSITLNTANGGTLTQEMGADVTADGNIAYSTNGGTITLQNGADITGGTGVNLNALNVNLGGVNAGDNSSVVATTGNITIQNNQGAHTLNVSLPDQALIEASTGDVRFNLVGAEGAITVNGGAGVGTTGYIHAGNSATEINHVRFNGGNNQVSVGADHIHGCIGGTGDSFLLTLQNVSPFTNDVHLGGLSTHNDFNFTSPGNLTVCGPITATNANPGQDPSINLNTANGGTLTQETGVDVTADGHVNYSTNGGTITLQNGADIVAGTGIDMNAQNFSLGGLNAADNSSLTTPAGDIIIHNTQGAHNLIVTLPDQSLIETTTGDVLFNLVGAEGAITVNGGAGVGTTGAIHAGNSALEIHEVRFNGGNNQISVGVDNTHGCTGGSGDSFLLTVVNVSPYTNDVHLGDITTHNDFSFTSPGSLTICGPITASNVGTDPTITLGTTGAASTITQETGATVTADGDVTYSSSHLILNDSTASLGGDIVVNNPNANTQLTVAFNAGSDFTAGGNVEFNSFGTNQGISITGGPGNGSITANNGNGTVGLNGGANGVSAVVNEIDGAVIGSGTTVLVDVANGNLTIGTSGGGTLTATNGDMNLTAQGLTTGGDINFNGDATATGGDINVNTGSGNVNLGNNADVTSTNGDIHIVAIDAPNTPLNVSLGNNSTIGTPLGDVHFNGVGNEGEISITGDGSILAPGHDVYYNIGGNTFTVDIREIQGCNHLLGATGNPLSVYMETQQGNIEFCTDVNTSSTTGVGGAITIVANGGAVDLEGNSVIASGAGGGGSITIYGNGGIQNGGDIISSGTNNSSGGKIDLQAPGQDIVVNTIQALGNGTGNGGSVTTVSSNLRVVDCDSNFLSIDVNAGTGGTGGHVSVTTTSNNPFIVGDSSVNGLECGIGANGQNGGLIQLGNNGGLVVNAGSSITANGTTGNGGVVVIGLANPGSGTLTVVNNGLIEATNNADTTGIVAFNTGPGQDLNLDTRDGIVHAGDCIHLGNVDPVTGEVISPIGGVLTVRGKNNLISDCIEYNGILPTPPSPPVPPAPPVPGTGGISPFQFFFGFLNGGGFLPFLPNGGNVNDFFVLSKTPNDITPPKKGWVSDEEDEEEAFIKQLRHSKMCGIIDGDLTYSTAFNTNDSELARLQTAGIQLASGSKDNYFNLDKGNMIFAPSKDIVVGTHEGNVHIPAGSVAFIMENGNDVAIYDFHQNGPKGIKIVSGGKLVTLDPGRMVLLSRSGATDFDAIAHHCRCIGYRHAKTQQLNSDITAFAMDFSIPSALSAVIPFKQMVASNNPSDKKTIEKIMMNAVLLQESTGYRGPFKTAH